MRLAPRLSVLSAFTMLGTAMAVPLLVHYSAPDARAQEVMDRFMAAQTVEVCRADGRLAEVFPTDEVLLPSKALENGTSLRIFAPADNPARSRDMMIEVRGFVLLPDNTQISLGGFIRAGDITRPPCPIAHDPEAAGQPSSIVGGRLVALGRNALVEAIPRRPVETATTPPAARANPGPTSAAVADAPPTQPAMPKAEGNALALSGRDASGNVTNESLRLQAEEMARNPRIVAIANLIYPEDRFTLVNKIRMVNFLFRTRNYDLLEMLATTSDAQITAIGGRIRLGEDYAAFPEDMIDEIYTAAGGNYDAVHVRAVAERIFPGTDFSDANGLEAKNQAILDRLREEYWENLTKLLQSHGRNHDRALGPAATPDPQAGVRIAEDFRLPSMTSRPCAPFPAFQPRASYGERVTQSMYEAFHACVSGMMRQDYVAIEKLAQTLGVEVTTNPATGALLVHVMPNALCRERCAEILESQVHRSRDRSRELQRMLSEAGEQVDLWNAWVRQGERHGVWPR